MSEPVLDVEILLSRALAPVEPPAELELRVEATLGSLVELAADELESWELAALRYPRNWARLGRPALAVVVGTSAAAGLVVMRTRRKGGRRRSESRNALDLAKRTLRDAIGEARRVVREVRPGR